MMKCCWCCGTFWDPGIYCRILTPKHPQWPVSVEQWLVSLTVNSKVGGLSPPRDQCLIFVLLLKYCKKKKEEQKEKMSFIQNGSAVTCFNGPLDTRYYVLVL